MTAHVRVARRARAGRDRAAVPRRRRVRVPVGQGGLRAGRARGAGRRAAASSPPTSTCFRGFLDDGASALLVPGRRRARRWPHALARVARDPELRDAAARRRPRGRRARYSWDASAAAHERAYEASCDPGERGAMKRSRSPRPTTAATRRPSTARGHTVDDRRAGGLRRRRRRRRCRPSCCAPRSRAASRWRSATSRAATASSSPACASTSRAERAGRELRYGRMVVTATRGRRRRRRSTTLVARAERFCWVSNTLRRRRLTIEYRATEVP